LILLATMHIDFR